LYSSYSFFFNEYLNDESIQRDRLQSDGKQKALVGKNTSKGLSNCGFRFVVFKGYRSVSKDMGCFHRVRIHLLDWILGVGLFVMTEQK